MKLKFYLTILTMAGFGLMPSLKAQYTADALRFSKTQLGSNARFKAIGNAHAGIGGDLSSLGGNPAGLGMFTRSEFDLTLEFNNYNNSATYLNKNSVGSRDALNLNQVGAVFHFPAIRPKGSDLTKGWVGFDFGIGYYRNADYGNNLMYSGTNPANSISDYFAELANKNFENPGTLAGTGSLEEMAYNDYLIGYDDIKKEYFPATEVPNTQTKNEDRKGGQNQLNMAFAANYSNKFYIGINLGFAYVNYDSEAGFNEKGYNISEDNNYQTTFLQQQNTKGKGFNAKMGFIYKPNSMIRLGAALETPTWYQIDDSYTEVLNTKYEKTGLENTNTAENYSFIYKLRTPMKITGGIGMFLGKFGFIAADVDWIDYSAIQFKGMNNNDIGLIYENNQSILNEFKKTMNYRLGAEIKLDQLMLRGGYGLQGNPYKNLSDKEFETKVYSTGLGYRIKNYYIDLSYQKVSYRTNLKPYYLANGSEPMAAVNNTTNNVFMTLGCRF